MSDKNKPKITSFIVTKLKSGFIVRSDTARVAVSSLAEVVPILTEDLRILDLLTDEDRILSGYESLLFTTTPTKEKA